MNYINSRGHFRPLWEMRLPPGKLLLLCLLFALPVRAELAAQLQREAESRLQAHAEQQAWPPYRAEFEPWLPAGAAQLPACEQAPRFSPAQPDARPWGRILYLIQCPDSPGWQIRARVMVRVRLPVWVAAEPLSREQELVSARLELQAMDIGRLHRGFVSGPRPGAQRLLRDLPAGEPLYPALLAPAWLVRRGEPVVIEAVGESFTISTRGLALDNGAERELIRVRNSDSGQEIRARVVGANRVRTLL
ncbi:flagellar basal body P-ring formation chaperone FlgA [Zobellella denitrificans]